MFERAAAVTEIPEHELLSPIAAGAYGEVWLARNAVGTLRAVKIVRRDRFELVEDFERELKGLQRFEPVSRTNDGLVDILQIGRNEDWFYYIMELADSVTTLASQASLQSDRDYAAVGGALHPQTSSLDSQKYQPMTLRNFLRVRGPLPAGEAVALGRRLASTLAYLHAHGLVHRDVKPSNILFIKGQAKLADAGLVTVLNEARSLVGTPGYIPPEGPGSPQADIFSLGKVLYEAAFGRDRQDFPQLPANLQSRPDHLMLLELNEILIRACQGDHRKRYQSARELEAELDLAHNGKSIRTRQKLRRYTNFFVAGIACSLTAWGVWFGVHQLPGISSDSNQGPKISAIKEATDEYTEGRYFYSKNSAANLRKAITRFERAIELDPLFAAPYAGLASCYGWVMPGLDSDFDKAKHFAEKALTLDAKSAEAHKVLAWLKFESFDWSSGLSEARQAIRLAPNDPEVHAWFAVPLFQMGQTKECITELKRAQELDQTSLSIPALLGLSYGISGQDDFAIQEISKVMVMETNAPSYAFRTLAEVYEHKGWFTKAIDIRQRCDELNGNWGDKQAAAYQAWRKACDSGPSGYWQGQLEILKELGGDPFYVGRCYAMLRDENNAFKWLLQASTGPSILLQYVMNDRALDSLRSDPRFKVLLRNVKLDQFAK
jgi:serine/threonine protein kinase